MSRRRQSRRLRPNIAIRVTYESTARLLAATLDKEAPCLI